MLFRSHGTPPQPYDESNLLLSHRLLRTCKPSGTQCALSRSYLQADCATSLINLRIWGFSQSMLRLLITFRREPESSCDENEKLAERVDISSLKKNNELAWLTCSRGPIDPKRVSARVANRGDPPGIKKAAPVGSGGGGQPALIEALQTAEDAARGRGWLR